MLLAIGHDNGQFVGLPINGALLSVQGPKIENGSSCGAAVEKLRHLNRIAESDGYGNGRPVREIRVSPCCATGVRP
jgi:hypothetical protein